MKVILISVGIFQEYMLDNIKNLILHKNTDIVCITELKFFNKLNNIANIELIDAETLDKLNYDINSKLDRIGRHGFWYMASLRLFLLYSYITKFNINNCIHIENDTMIYCNLETLASSFTDKKSYAIFDSEKRVIPSFIYIYDQNSFRPIIERYDYNKNDMENMALSSDILCKLPIYIKTKDSFVGERFDEFNCIFDGAAIGQYLGGIDPLNTQEPNTIGFVNETCIVKYNNNSFYWKQNENGLYCPYIEVNNKLIQIINLHIHSKRLYAFMSDDPLECTLINKI
jgi:hypothetical protein